MADFGLLAQQTSLPHIPEQRLPPKENDIRNSSNGQLFSTGLITPPEFIQTNEIAFTPPSKLKPHHDKIAQRGKNNHLKADGLKLADSLDSTIMGTNGVKIIKKTVKVSSSPLPILRFGHAGISVRVLQRLLLSNGYNIEIDGVFGPLTEIAVKAFQNQKRLNADGIVGQRTWLILTG